jgi:transposase-like protein
VPRTRPPYPEEFKREAIELVRLTGKSVRQVALEVAAGATASWVRIVAITGENDLAVCARECRLGGDGEQKHRHERNQ